MTLKEYAELALSKGATCFDCGRTPALEDLNNYDHDSGWEVDGFEELQWLYFECSAPSCSYQTSFTKLSVRRPSPAQVV